MATAEIMPLEIRGEDKSAAAWRSLKGNVLEARSAVDSLSQGLRGLQTLSAGSFSTLASSANMATRALTNPFTAAAAAVIAVGTAAYFADQKLSSLGKTAYEVGEAASTIDGLEKAIKRTGGETENAASALKNMQKEVEKAGRDKGDLHELFKVNDSSLKDSQGNLKSLNEVYRQTAQFIQNAASETDRLDIATRAFGSDAAPAMVKAIMDGADALDRLGGNEGLDPLVAQAREFDRMWKEIGGIINEVGYSIRDKLLPAMEAFYGYARLIAAALGSNAAKQSNFLANTPGAQRMWDTGSQREIDQFYKGVFGDKNRTKVPGDEDDEKDSFKKNEFDRAVNSITKHIAIMNADAAAVGKTAGEMEKLRTQAQLEDAARQAGIPIIGKQAEKFKELSEQARRAADALAFRKLQNDIGFERGQIGRSVDEQAVFSRLRGAGIDADSEQGRFLAAELRLNDALRETKDLASSALKGFITDVMSGKSAMEALSGVFDKFAAKALDKGVDMLMSGIFGGMSGGGQGGFGILGKLFASANGNVFQSGSIQAFAAGGIVSRPTLFPMANGAGLMGEAGPEAIMPLKRTGSGALGVQIAGRDSAPAAQPVVISFHNDFRGADKGAVAGIAIELKKLKASFNEQVKAALISGRATAPGAWR